MKMHEEFKLFEELWNELNDLQEARKNNPTPPTKIKIVKIEPKLQGGYDTAKWRHYDEITYVDPYLNVEQKVLVWEERPGFGKYFGWGAKHSGNWDYAAYDYNGELLPDVDPMAGVSLGTRQAISKEVAKINR